MKARAKTLTPWKRFRYLLEATLISVLAFVVRQLPRRGAHALGSFIGWMLYQFYREQRRVAFANLDLAFGDSKTPREKRRIARLSFQNSAATLVSLLWAPRINRQVVDELIEFAPGDEHRISELYEQGKGLICLSLHYGDWEFLGLAMGFLGVPLTIVAQSLRNPALQARIEPLRTMSGQRVIPQAVATLKLLRALKRGGAIALLGDLNAGRRSGGVWVDFFGVPVFNNAAIAALALRTGAPVLCAVARPQPDGRLRLVFGRPIKYKPTGDYETDIQRLSQECLSVGEDLIRANPEFWLWSYKRWRLRRTADQGRYPFYSKYAPRSN
jgi:Kdo2-lipid IVA lauroyltransferase/acyltransferase